MSYQQILAWLRDGTFAQGSMLSENDPLKRLAVSRAPVRGAFLAELRLHIHHTHGSLMGSR